MSLGSSIRLKHRPSLAFLLLCGFMAVLWLAGGASRADVMGQVVVRAAAWGAMIAALLGVFALTCRSCGSLLFC